MSARWFRPRRGPADAAREMRDEIETHVAMWTDDLVRRGMPRDEAERQARARFGDYDASVEQLVVSARTRETRRDTRERWHSLRRDLALTWRQLRRQPVFSIVTVLTFAIGVGANTAIFSVVRAALLRPLPYADPSHLAAIWPARTISNAELVTMQREARSFSAVAAFSPGWGIALTGAGEPRQLDAARVSTNFFTTLGVTPRLGRGFRDEESAAGNWNVAVLSHRLWLEQFGADPRVLGRVIDMDGTPTRIIGVMHAGFEAFQPSVDAWLPLMIDPASPYYTGQTALAFGRLSPRTTTAGAQAELASLAVRMRGQFNFPADYAQGATVTSLQDSLVGGARRPLLVLFGAVVLLVLIAMVNVGNLMLVHAVGRQRELAVRRALGAQRSQLVAQLITQSLVVAVLGGAAGVALGWLGVRGLRVILPPSIPMLRAAHLDLGVLVTCALCVVAAGVLFGVAPALFATRVDPQGALRAGSAQNSSRSHARLRSVLVSVESSLAVVLVIGAGLMGESLWRLSRVDLGFDPGHVTSFRIQPSSGQTRSAAETATYFAGVASSIASIAGVDRVGASQHLPLTGFNWRAELDVEGAPLPSTATKPRVIWRSIAGDYFGAMRIPLLRGRAFDARDTRDAPPVVIVSAAMAAKHWPTSDAIGKRIMAGNATRREWATIVGVVGDVQSIAPGSAAPEEIYRPNAQQGLTSMHFVVRTAGDPRGVQRAIHDAVRSLDRVVPIAEVRSLRDVYASATADRRTIAVLLAAFAAAGLLLGAVGIYGVIAYSVTQRTREIGIRQALGAAQRRMSLMVVGETLRIAGAGIAVGVAAALVAARVLDSLVFGMSTHDPLLYAAVSAVVALVAVVAAFVPARRAAAIDPVIALRSE
jgi:predicted permease